jgi:hypothetical protein
MADIHGRLPLHWALMAGTASEAALLALLAAHPAAIGTPDSEGRTGLHAAFCAPSGFVAGDRRVRTDGPPLQAAS